MFIPTSSRHQGNTNDRLKVNFNFVFFQNETYLCRRFTSFVTKYNLMSKDNLIVPILEGDSGICKPLVLILFKFKNGEIRVVYHVTDYVTLILYILRV